MVRESFILVGESEWKARRQINFTVDGRESFIVCPDRSAPGRPWVWRAEFFGAFDTADTALLGAGWHLAFHRVSDMYGCPESTEYMRRFYLETTSRFGLSKKPAVFGFSRGGLYAVNFALAYPDAVGALYLDAPVLDIRSWPCGGADSGYCRSQCMALYNLTEETLPSFGGNPLDRAEELALHKIPVIIVAGDADETVPYSENGAPFAERFRAAGGDIKTIVKPGCDHHPHSLADPSPVVSFLTAKIKKQKSN